MQLKHKGKQVAVTLTKPESKMLDKAAELLATIAMLPCAQKERANEAWKAVSEIAGELEKVEAE